MTREGETRNLEEVVLKKSPTGIKGLDEITNGGLPQGRTTLVCGAAGSGKTMLAMEYLVHGAQDYGEPGVFMAFEETEGELVKNFASLGFDLTDLADRKLMHLEYVSVERSEIEETGEYDLEGLFIRLGYAIDSIGAKRVVLDTIEALFAGLSNASILRAELRRLFHWLKEKGVTVIVTGERGESTFTRQGMEEYVSDCVILLDYRVVDSITTRRLRIVKYRGSSHGANEYPFLIDERGFSIQPVTSLGLSHEASDERVSSGIPRLDHMLEGRGFYRGSSVLVSGTAGTGKSSIAASFVHSVGRRGERCIYFAMEESEGQIVRNMRSIGIDLEPLIQKGLLQIYSARPSLYGLEMHLVTMQKMVEEFEPQVVVVDPITNLITVGSMVEVRSMLTRLIDWLKMKKITSLYTNLTHSGEGLEQTEAGISSLMDTWLLVRDIELNGERNRGMYVLKSRGMAHSNQIREFMLTDQGVEIMNVYLGPEGVLTGTSRVVQEAQEKQNRVQRLQEVERRRRELEHKRQALESQIDSLRAKFAAEEEDILRVISEAETKETVLQADRYRRADYRKSDINWER